MPVEVATPWARAVEAFPWLGNGREPPLTTWTRAELLEARAADSF